jgi:murein DD-endopeptidase MepM/ murein hydrolase activator NlpD
MGDHRAGNGTSVTPSTGKRVARHAAETIPDEPYVGRRIATPPQAADAAVPSPEALAPAPVATPTPVRTEPDPLPAPITVPVVAAAPVPVPAPVLRAATVRAPVTVPVSLAAPAPFTLTTEPDRLLSTRIPQQPARRVAPKAPSTRPGRRVARRRSLIPHMPSAPVLMGIAILGISAGGALQAVHPDLAGAANGHHLAPASALSGSSAVSSARLQSSRAGVVSRDADRASLSSGNATSLEAQADARLKQRNLVLSEFAAKAQQRAQDIRLHQWVLPVAVGVYHLTARFGDYSPLWSHFHTGLDFAAPTGTPIMAVAGGTITDVGYSGAYGNRTIETLADGTELWYCHQNSFGTTVGATVRPGEVIGYVGSTGNVTGPHLHLEVHPGGGDPVDPYAALVAHGLYPGPPA